MRLPTHVIAIDQGTTSTRAIAFDRSCLPAAAVQQEFPQIYPAPGLVEHDPEAIWRTTVETVRAVDSFLLWRLTGGRVHATDATNAARTLLLDLRHGEWEAGLTKLFGVPLPLLPQVRDCAADFGITEPGLFGGPIRILGIAGD